MTTVCVAGLGAALAACCELPAPEAALETGVTLWHTEHFTLCAPTGYMSVMLQPPQTTWP